jgi:hypothetical protein
VISTWPPTLGRGPQGLKGLTGGFSLLYKFESGTGTPPSSGRIRFNHATPASATHVYVHDTDRQGVDLDGVLDLAAVGDLLVIASEANPSKFHIFEVDAMGRMGPVGPQGPAGADGADGVFSQVAVTYKTDSSFSTSSTSFVDITGASVAFTQGALGLIKVEVVGAFGDTAAPGTAHDAILAVQVDGGSDFPLTGTDELTDGSGNDTRIKPLTGMIAFSGVGAGAHTVKARLRRRNNGSGANAQVCATADLPFRMTVWHS